MPFVHVQTNQTVSHEDTAIFLEALTDLIADQLGKSKDYVQVMLEPGCPMAFGGTMDLTARIELRSLGLPEEGLATLTEQLCALVESKLYIRPSRTFINYFDHPRTHWGWNGKNFG